MTPMPWREGISARLASQLDSLTSLLNGYSNAAFEPRTNGKWSPLDNLAHLARYHEVFLARMERIVREDKPRLPRYRAEEDPEWPAWRNLEVVEVVARLQSRRSTLIDTFQKLSPEQLGRVGVHSRYGEMTLELWMEFFLLHEAHHLYVILQRVGESNGATSS
jgi:DinB superfamily